MLYLLKALEPLLVENVERLREDLARQEPLLKRRLGPEIERQEAMIHRIQEAIERLQALDLTRPPS